MSESLFRSRYVLAGGVRTHYVEAGDDGPPVVLCHGGAPGFSGELSFGKIVPQLGTKFRVIAFDAVGGYGYTDPRFPADEGVRSRVVHLEAVLDTLCLERVCLAGNSQGAWVAAKFALLHPERVHRLVLTGSGTIASAMGLDHSGTEGLRAIRAYDGTAASMRRLLETLLWNKAQITDDLVARYQAVATLPGAAQAREVFAKGMQRLTQEPGLRGEFRMTGTLPHMKTPALFLWGEEDRFAPAALGKELEKLLPNIRFEFVPEAGHLAQNDQPERVARMMLDFLAG